MKIRQEKYIYLHNSDTTILSKAKKDCIDDSYYKCATSKAISNNFEGWNFTHCFPKHLVSLGSYDTNLQCENEEIEDLALWDLYMESFYQTNCPKPCSIVQYTGRLDAWDSWSRYDNDSTISAPFTLHIRFAPPVNAKVYEEYLIYDIFGLIGTVGGTLGIFIGFSCRDIVNLITHMFQKLIHHQALTNAFSKIKNCEIKCT